MAAIFHEHYHKKHTEYKNQKSKSLACAILLSAINQPFIKICENAGKTDLIIEKRSNPLEGWDIKTSQKGNMIEMGIIDPLKVTKEALLNAVAVSKSILSTLD